MEISENWLREWADPAIYSDTLVSQLTMAGLEVEGLRSAAPKLTDVVVAEVVAVEKHPDADKLKVCQVSDGQESYAVVCGARNVRANLKVAFARIGAELPGIKIKKAKLQRIALTARLSLDAYDAITEIQRHHRRKTRKHKCLWEILDAAILAYAKEQRIEFEK